MKEKLVEQVIFVEFQTSWMIPSLIAGAKTLNVTRDRGVDIKIGEKPGVLTIRWKGKKIYIPLANCKAIQIEEEITEETKDK